MVAEKVKAAMKDISKLKLNFQVNKKTDEMLFWLKKKNPPTVEEKQIQNKQFSYYFPPAIQGKKKIVTATLIILFCL